MADSPNPLHKSATDVVAEKFGALLDNIEDQETEVQNRIEAGQDEVEPEGEPEVEEIEDEAEPELVDEDDPEAGEGQPDATPERTYKVRVRGQELEVTESELVGGYQRLADYTRSKQEAAQLKKESEAALADAREKREAYAKQLDEANDWLNSMVPKEPDWATLRTTKTPQEYAATHAQWQEFTAIKKTIEDKREKVNTERAAELRTQVEQYVAAEGEKLLQVKPEWKDPAKFEKARKELTRDLISQGWQQEQIDNVVDHRLVLALYNDMRYRKAQKGAPAPKIGQARRSGIRTVVPGSGSPPAPRAPESDKTRSMERLRQTGKTADAARHFETLL